MSAQFKTYAEAAAAGYTKANKHNSQDVSGGKWFGYDFKDSDGNKSVDVYLTEEKNRMNTKGCVVPMFPPSV